MKAPALAARGSLGGLLMGLANLVPGISGGTMLLAAGVYRGFIEAIAEVTTLKFRPRSLLLLGAIGTFALAAIVLLAGPTKALVSSYRWIMYSLFLGLTFGGVPIVWRMARPPRGAFWAGALAGFAGMAAMAFLNVGRGGESGVVLLAVAGIAGASAMILPGVSGAYLLLILGQYETVLGAVDQLKQRDLSGALPVLAPVAVGVLVGIVGVSNLIRWSLRKHEQATLGILIGLLFGSVLGIYPFQEVDPAYTIRKGDRVAVAAAAGPRIEKQRVGEDGTIRFGERGAHRFAGKTIGQLRKELSDRLGNGPVRLTVSNAPLLAFAPALLQVAACLALIVAGFAATCLIDRLGAGEGETADPVS